jgi:hypothetical protein
MVMFSYYYYYVYSFVHLASDAHHSKNSDFSAPNILSSYKHCVVVHQTNSKKPKPTKYKLLLLYTEKEILEY